MEEEWEDDDDEGYYSLTVSLEEFLSMETLSLARLSETNGMPLDMFACDLWRGASDAMHECCDPARVAVEEVDGEMEQVEEVVEEVEEVVEVAAVQVSEENYQEENEEFELSEEYYHYQRESFVGLLCEMEIEVRNFLFVCLLLLLLFSFGCAFC